MSRKKTRINPGQVISCPKCKVWIFEFVKPLEECERLSLEHIEPVHKAGYAPAQNLVCPDCTGVFMHTGAVHLSFGWYPYDPMVK